MKTTLKPLIVSILILSSTMIFAQNPGDPPVDPGISPINDYIIPMMVLGMALGLFMLKKKTQEV
jgi:hypothetical protein